MNRRTFITSLAAGAGLIAMPPPVRRFWQVPGNAPVGRPIMGVDLGYGADAAVVVFRTDFDDGTSREDSLAVEEVRVVTQGLLHDDRLSRVFADIAAGGWKGWT